MSIRVSIILLVSSFTAAKALLNECPPLAQSSPCRCVFVKAPSVVCSKINSYEQLESAFETLKGYKLVDLTLLNINASSIPLDALHSVHTEYLAFDRFEVRSADLDIQDYQGKPVEDSLKILDVSNSFKRDAPLAKLKLDNLKNLESLFMNDNIIPEVGNEWFMNGPKGLNYILLERNGIKLIADKAFQSLDNLQILWVKGNPLSEISRSMFPSSANKLEKIDLSNNKIKKLSTDVFSDMPLLEFINLANNQLQVFEDNSATLKKTHIHLEDNPLICDEKLRWICSHQVNSNTAKCASPLEKEDISLQSFCDS